MGYWTPYGIEHEIRIVQEHLKRMKEQAAGNQGTSIPVDREATSESYGDQDIRSIKQPMAQTFVGCATGGPLSQGPSITQRLEWRRASLLQELDLVNAALDRLRKDPMANHNYEEFRSIDRALGSKLDVR